jgi:arylsulfatase
MYVAYTSPHWPLHALPEDIARYRGKYKEGWDVLRERRYKRMIQMGIIRPEWKLTPRDESAAAWDSLSDEKKDFFDLKMAVYAAQIDRMDQGIGRIMKKLEELKIDRNTLVMFLADNGGCAEEINRGKEGGEIGTAESYTSYGLPWANASNTPFRLYKHWEHEGGISTPLIAHWPAVIQDGGKLTSQPGHLIDLMATCVDVAGATYPSEHNGKAITPLEGKSLAPIFRTGTREGHEAIYREHEGNRAVRQGKWKLVALNKKPWELYDLDADRTELNNLASSQPDRVAAMSKMWDAWAAKVGAKMPEQLREQRQGPRARRN